jgi:hypothetical protein
MITGHHLPGYPGLLRFRAGEAAGRVGGVGAVEDDGAAGGIAVYALYDEGVIPGW